MSLSFWESRSLCPTRGALRHFSESKIARVSVVGPSGAGSVAGFNLSGLPPRAIKGGPSGAVIFAPEEPA